MKWHKYYLDMLENVGKLSPDKHSKVSCIFTDGDHIILMTGYNGFPRKVIHEDYRLERPEKYHWMAHAETNGIANAARKGVALHKSTLYTSAPPCVECTKLIINVGVQEIVMEKVNWESWWKSESGLMRDIAFFSIHQRKMLKEVGIPLILVNGKEICSI